MVLVNGSNPCTPLDFGLSTLRSRALTGPGTKGKESHNFIKAGEKQKLKHFSGDLEYVFSASGCGPLIVTLGMGGLFRPEDIMLKILPIILFFYSGKLCLLFP